VKTRRTWPLFLIGLPAAVAVWSGWVGLGGMCGFGIIHPLPGIADSFQLNTAITLPIGVEAYGGYALGVWADLATPQRVRRFAFRSALGSLALGLLGQVAYHLLAAAGYAHAPWLVTMFVSCIPVAAIGFGMGLHQLLIHTEADGQDPAGAGAPPARTTAEIFSDIARTITPVPETPDPGPLEPLHEPEGTEPEPWLPPADPDPGPDAPVPPGSGLQVPDEVDELLARWDDPVPEDDLDAEAREVFGPVPSPEPGPAPVHHEDAPRPAPARKPASPAKEWTPASVGRTEDEVAAMVRSLSRNKLAEALPCSRTTADKLRARYLQPATAGANGSR
jgi:hypothetical protein